MHPLQHAAAVCDSVIALPSEQKNAAILVVVVVAVLIVLTHEFAHWATAKLCGVTGKLRLFARRGESKAWFLGVLSIDFRDEDVPVLSLRQWRIVAAAGPSVDLVAGLSCFAFGLNVPGPAWLAPGIAMIGMFWVPCSLINSIPIRCLKNDGWYVIRPDTMVTKD